MTTELFDVWQWFADETHERVGESLPARQAVELAHSYVNRPAARMGIIAKVQIVCCDDDSTAFLWEHAKGPGALGITFPPREPSA